MTSTTPGPPIDEARVPIRVGRIQSAGSHRKNRHPKMGLDAAALDVSLPLRSYIRYNTK